MHGDEIGGPIRWRMHLPVPPEQVFAALATDAGRAAFWALLALEYLGGPVRFELTPDGEGGTELRMTHEGVRAAEWIETHAGWLNVLFPLKAWVLHGVDLRNQAPDRTWEEGYADG